MYPCDWENWPQKFFSSPQSEVYVYIFFFNGYCPTESLAFFLKIRIVQPVMKAKKREINGIEWQALQYAQLNF
jgi:hypothetical protein